MSSVNIKIPQIAITLDVDGNNQVANTISETFTDVEDLEESETNKIKSDLKFKLTTNGGATDFEDIEVSESDIDTRNVNIKHISLDDLLLETSSFEETILADEKNKGNFETLSQKYKELLEVSELFSDEGITDTENLESEHELKVENLLESDVNSDDYHPDSVHISTFLKNTGTSSYSKSAVSSVVEASELTDVESLTSDSGQEYSVKKCKVKRKKIRSYKNYNGRYNGGSDLETEKKYKQFNKMKKSLSHPFYLSLQDKVLQSDDKVDEKCFLKTSDSKRVTKEQRDNLTDTEVLEETFKTRQYEGHSDKQKSTVNYTGTEKRHKFYEISGESYYYSINTDDEVWEGKLEESDSVEITLPPPVRTLVFLHEDKSLRPTTNILPLDETLTLGSALEDDDISGTDTEFWNIDELLEIERIERAPTPEVLGYEISHVTYGEELNSSLKFPRRVLEPSTDVEELAVEGKKKQVRKPKNKTLQLLTTFDPPTTEIEDLYISDSTKSPLKRQTSIESLCIDDEDLDVGSTFYINEDSITSSKNNEGLATNRSFFNVPQMAKASSPELTDMEDLMASADEDVIRSEIATPKEFFKHLDQQRSSRIHIEATKKLNLDSPNEIMYLKGGLCGQNNTDVEEVSDEMQEWDVSKKPTPQELSPLTKDAEQQAMPNYVTYESVLLKHVRDASPSSPTPISYKQIDDMLEKMLSEVEKQEKLFSLDLDLLEPNDDSYINTLELVPETDALIEIPVKKTNVFSSFREIQIINEEHKMKQVSTEEEDVDDYLADCLVSSAKCASNESLSDTEDESYHAEYDYEPIEYNALTHAYQRLDSYPESDIWFEGTYRNLSIVPEEDEDENTSLLSSYSNYRKPSFSSNQYSLSRSSATKDYETESNEDDSESTDNSDLDDAVEKNESIIKAEVKLLVKTTEHGKEAIEIRSVKEFLENPIELNQPASGVKKKSPISDKISNLKSKFSCIVDRSKRNFALKEPSESETNEKLLKDDTKPSFTFQQLFVKTPESLSENPLKESSRFGSRNELVVSPSDRFPLVYEPETPSKDDEALQNVRNVDLHANIPFYPCYQRTETNQYSYKMLPSPHTNPFTETISNPFLEGDQVPRGYCDWLEDLSGGLSTTTERLVASNEETLLDKPLGQPLTGLSVIDDNNLLFDLKTVFEQTNAFIQSESQPEPYDALAEKYTKKEPINDKKVDDNKNNTNEKKKTKKGFFGSIKTFVERSFESDSESEKSPKKSKKPKKDKKKSKDEKVEIVSEPSLPPKKPKLPTPPLAPSDIDSIPFAEASVSDLPPPYKPPKVPAPKPEPVPITDLDADLYTKPAAKLKIDFKEIERESEKPKEKQKEFEKIKEKQKEPQKEKTPPKKKLVAKTIVVEEITKKIEPLVVETEEFSIVVDPTKKESPKKSKEIITINMDESVEKIEKQIMEKQPILSEEKIVKPIVAMDIPIRPPRTKDHIYEDIEAVPSMPITDIKNLTTNLIQNEINFGGWIDDTHKKYDETMEKIEKEEIYKEIVEKQDKEVSKEKDAKVKTTDDESKKKEEKKGGFFGLFKKKDSKKEDEEPSVEQKKLILSETVIKDIADTNKFLSDEVQNYHDIRPVVAAEKDDTIAVDTTISKPETEEASTHSEGILSLFKKTKKDEKTPGKRVEKKDTEKKLEKKDSDKKTKKGEKKTEPLSEKKVAVILSEEVLKNMFDSKRFLEDEVQNYYDVKPETVLPLQKQEIFEETKQPLLKNVIDEKKESLPKTTTEEKKTLSPDKKVDEKKRTDSREASPKPSFFNIFKKSRKDESEVVNTKATFSDEAIKDMKDTEQFLVAEIQNYHDAESTKEEIEPKQVIETDKYADTVEAPQSGGVLGLFKKGKKEEPSKPEISETVSKDLADVKPVLEEIKSTPTIATKPQMSEPVLKDMADTTQFLNGEIESYHDVKPVKVTSNEEITIMKDTTESVEQPSSGFFGLFKKTKKDDEKLVPEDTKEVTKEEQKMEVQPPVMEGEKVTKIMTEEVTRESSPKLSGGFFGLFKKSKKDEEEAIPGKPVLSDSVLKDMNDTQQFLSLEVDKYEDVKPEKFEPIADVKIVDESLPTSPKSRGILGIFKKTKKEQEEQIEKFESKPMTSEAVTESTIETTSFLITDAKPEKFGPVEDESFASVTDENVESSPKLSKGIFGIFKKSKKEDDERIESKPTISKTALKTINDSTSFLATEVQNYEDVKPEKFEPVQEERIIKVIEDGVESSPKSRGILGIFKKSKKEQEEQSQPKPALSEMIIKEMEDTSSFLKCEVQNYHDAILDTKPEPIKPDVKPETLQSNEEEKVTRLAEEVSESSPKPSRGLFSIFKKSKKDSEDQMEAKFPLSSEMEDSKQFLGGDEQNSHYAKPEKDITSERETSVKALEEKVIKVKDDRVTKTLEEESQSSPKPSRGIFGIFKKSTKEEEEPVEIKVVVSEEVKKQIKDTDKFLTEEVKHYHDVKVSMEERVIKVSEEVKEASPKHAGILSIFKKSKKDEEERSTLSETVLKNMEETEHFLTVEVEYYHDVKPITSQERASAKEEGPKEEALKIEFTEDLQPKVEQPKGFLAKFKKTKKKPSLLDTEGSGEIEKDVMDETKKFISTEMEKYEDGKLEEKKEDKVVTFDGTKSQMVLEGHLPELKIAQVVEVVKKDVTEIVKETQGKVKEIDDVKKETTDEISSEKQEDQEPKITKKDKQAKDKKGFLGIFGKKSKSQESSLDESRGREEESEGSPKKQKRRKSSSPFKFFDKMKKSDEDVKEEENEVQVTTKVEEPLKETEESKEDLLATEIKHPSLNLSEEVLGSLDKKMKELKSKYSPQTNKVINDCRDFLFIEVDNYEDSKPVVITDIDAGVAVKTVDDIIKKAEEIVDDSRVEIDDESQKFSDKVTTGTYETEGGIKTAARTTEKTCKLVADLEEAPKKTAKKAGSFFSKLGGFITGAVEDSNSDLKEVKAAAEKTVDKKKKAVVAGIESTTKSVETKMEAVKDDVAKLEEQGAEILNKAKEDTVDVTTKKYSEVKEGIDKILKKTETKYDTFSQKVKDDTSKGINDIKENIDMKIDEALESTKHIKEGADKSDNADIAFEKVIKTGEDFKESYKQLQTISDKLSETTEKVQDESNQQIKQTSKILKEAKDKAGKPSITLVDVCKSKVEDLKEEVQKTKERETDSVVKIIDDLTRVKESETEAMTEEAKEVKSAAKSPVEIIVDRGQAKLDDIGKAKDDLVETKTLVKESVEEKISDVSKATDQIVHDFDKGKDTVQKAVIQESYDISKTSGIKIDALSKVKDDTSGKLVAKVEDTEKIVDATLTAFTNKTEKITEKLTETEEAIKKIEQKTEDISKTKEKVVGDIAPTVETVHLLVGQKTEDMSQITSQKVDDLSETKDSIIPEVSVKIDDVKESISSLKEGAEKIGEKSAEKLSKANESVKMSIMQKVGEVSKMKDQAIDYISKRDRTIKDIVVEETDDISKVVIQKTGDLTKTEKELNERISAKIEDVNKGIDTTAITLKERPEQITENLKEAKETVKASVKQAADDIFKTTSKKTDDLGINKESVLGEFAKSKEDSQIIKDKAVDYQTTITQKMDDVSKATLQKIEDITKIDEKLKTSTDQRFDVCSKEDQNKTHDSVNIEEDNRVTVTKKENEEAAQKVDELAKTSIQSELDENKDELSKTAFQKIDDVTAAKETVTQMTDGTPKITSEVNGKKSLEIRIDGSFKIDSEKADDLVRTKRSAKELTGQTVDDFLKTSIKKADDLTSTQKIDDLTKTQETKKETTVVHASKLIDSEVKGTTQAASTQDVKQLRADVVGTVTTQESLKDKAFQKVEKDLKITSQDTNKFVKEKQEIADELEKSKDTASQQILGSKSDTSDGTATKEAMKRGYELKQFDDTSDLSKKTSDKTSSKKEDISLKMMELDEELVKLTSSLEQLSEPKSLRAKTLEKVKSYVTSPTMARRAESQRFPRGDRPAVREVISVQPDEDSDEECYTVTEPEEPKTTKRRPLFHIESEEDDSLSEKLKERRDSATSNVLETLTETKLDTLLTNLENQLVEDLEKSVVEGRERVVEDKEKGDKKVMQVEKELETIKIESQADVEQIEQKLRDLDKALDSLEQASDPNSKLEKKLHRVERKFERMASEVMEKEITGASPTEVEARREHEFQKLVSQLSTEEVSDFQKEYSHLWDETTFSKSDEWDSKTPDSQVDVQELPQGEVVYMGPVTLNKDNLVNKAGVEVDVIPIMRSPCHTPKPTKKNIRARSAMDFYEGTSTINNTEFDRGSLPDLKATSLKGPLVSTIVQLNPDRFLYGSTTSLHSNASSSSEMSRGEIMSAVLDWLEKSNQMHESSVDSASVASSDSNISQLSAGKPGVPTIRITKGKGKKRSKRKSGNAGVNLKERRETTCAPTLTEEIKTVPQPKPRFVKETPLQFVKQEGRQPKLEKQISPVRDDLLDDVEEEVPPVPETYSDKKKFWENVTKEQTTTTKRMSLQHEITSKEKDLLKKRVSVHEVSTAPVPKPRTGVSQSVDKTSEEEVKVMSEYQASFQPPSERKTKSPSKPDSDKESTDSESDNIAHSGINENAGYISDSGDVEHYISDSEIEDRVPQIRERQMSVFAPPVAAVRKTIYERSASLPTEDLYEVSARSIKLRKQYYEEQIKKEMIEEQLTSELEEEPSPERKTLLQQEKPVTHVRDIARSFDEAVKRDLVDIAEQKEVSFEDNVPTHKSEISVEDQAPISTQIQETHKEMDLETHTKRSSLGSEHDSSSDVDKITKDGSTSKPDSMEVHVDKSEIEDSEKLAELDQDATDLETKSLDSLNAVEMSPKSSYFVEESIPEITVTLSGKQRRISEESDEYVPRKEEKKAEELGSPIHVPEEHVEDTVWEVSVQSQPEARFDEKVTSFDAATVEKIEKDEDLSLSTRDESDLGSEIHQDHSDSYASDKIKSESHSDIERIILDSLHQQKVDPEEAKAIASALIEEIEAEIQRRECLPPSTTTSGDVSDYLKYLAETKGLDEREVELVESVLARRQRELAKLSRGDTQASSIEITDEDLKYSGAETDSSHLLEQQISQLKAEKVDDIKSMTFLDKIDEKHSTETHLTKDYETREDGYVTAHKSDLHTKTYESIKGEKTETKDTIFEEDETISESVAHESEQVESKVEAVVTELSHKKTDKSEIDESRKSTVDVSREISTEITAKTTEKDDKVSFTKQTDDSAVTCDITKSSIKHEINKSEKKIDEDIDLRGEITCDDILKKEESTKKEISSEIKDEDGVKVEREETVEARHAKTLRKEIVGEETEEVITHKNDDSTIKQSKISSKTTSVDVLQESSTTSEVKEKTETFDLDPSLLSSKIGEIKQVIEKHEEIKRTSSSESKSSVESGKSPDDQFSTCSSGRKGDSDTSKEKQEVLLRKTTSVQKADRKSGVDFETYSSSGESHYHSFELDSGKSRPCSSDVEGLVAAGSSEYESALTSQDYSSRSHITSTEYHTAVSSLSSKESMKSLDSESSGHLGSVEVSELSETLVPSASDAEGDILDMADQLDDSGWPEDQINEMDVVEEPVDKQSKMKRSHEMTFQPEPKLLTSESPKEDDLDKKFTSMDDGSILSMSLSSTSGTEPQTVIELSRADSERVEGGSMSVSGISDQLSIEGSCDSLVFHPPVVSTTTDMSTSTGLTDTNLQIESITFTTSMVNESGIRSVSTQVTSESHSPEEDRSNNKVQEAKEMNGKCHVEIKKKSHRRQESTSSFVPVMSSFEQKFHSDLTESDKYTPELSFKEVISDEKKDIDEREKEESYETEADQGFHRDMREGKYQETEEEIKDDTPEFSSETQASVGELEQEYTSALARSQETKKKSEIDLHIHKEPLEKRDSHGKSSSTSSEKSSFEEAEAEAAFNMVAHVSPAHKIKQICPILEDEDAEKHELETRERTQKEYEKRKSQIRDQSPGSIPDIKVTQHMTPLVDRNFHYPDLELEEQERQKEKEKESETQKSTPQTPSSKSSEETDQGREYVLEDSGISIPEEQTTESKSTVIEKTVKEEGDKDTDSPNSDSFEMLEKPDLIDDFVVIEEVAKEAQEFDTEGKSVSIQQQKSGPSRQRPQKKHDEEVEAYLTHSAPTPLTKMTEVKYYPDGSSSEELGFDFEDSPPVNVESSASSYEKELEANKKWIEQQFQGDQAARLAAGYDYEMEFERGPLEDIKEEDINDFDPTSSRIGSLGSQKESGGSLGSVKDSYSSTPEYDVLAGRKYFTRSGEHDDISMSSLQEFENLERAMSLETKRYHQGSQDSSSNGSFKTRYYASKSGQGDDVSVSSLKEFEGLEMACIAAHKIEVKAKEEEAMLAQIDEGQESLASESESCETVSRTDKKLIPDSDEEDYEKRMFEIDEIIRQAQSNVERFIDLKEVDKTESLGRGDSIEEVARVPDLDLDTPIVRSSIKVQWKGNEDVMMTSIDSIEGKPEEGGSRHDSTDSLDQKTCADIMTASTDSIEFQAKKPEPINLLSDSIEGKDEACGMVQSDSLELAAKQTEAMLESTDSLADPTSSTATHATYQYETDSVFSGSFTSGGSNTMVSSTDTIDPVQVDIAAAARKVWFDEDSKGFTSTEYVQDSAKPYVTEVIEPCEDDVYSHTIHRRVELPPEVRKVTFYGTDAEERLRQFIEDFGEGEHIEEVEEVDAAGNVHTRRVVQKRVIVRGEEGPEMEDFLKNNGLASKTNQLTSKDGAGEESNITAVPGTSSTVPEGTLRAQASRRRQLRYEISVDDQIEVDPREHDWRFNLPKHAESEEAASRTQQTDRTSQQRPIADQHQLSEEMKELLKELEKESKQ